MWVPGNIDPINPSGEKGRWVKDEGGGGGGGPTNFGSETGSEGSPSPSMGESSDMPHKMKGTGGAGAGGNGYDYGKEQEKHKAKGGSPERTVGPEIIEEIRLKDAPESIEQVGPNTCIFANFQWLRKYYKEEVDYTQSEIEETFEPKSVDSKGKFSTIATVARNMGYKVDLKELSKMSWDGVRNLIKSFLEKQIPVSAIESVNDGSDLHMVTITGMDIFSDGSATLHFMNPDFDSYKLLNGMTSFDHFSVELTYDDKTNNMTGQFLFIIKPRYME